MVKRQGFSSLIFVLLCLLGKPLWSQTLTLPPTFDLALSPNFFVETIAEKKPAKLGLIEQSEHDLSDCQNCPTYLNLSAEMIQILQNLNSTNNTVHPLEEARLNLLYYTVKHEQSSQTIDCYRYPSLLPARTRFAASELSLISEELIDLPNIEEILISPYLSNQTVYTFRGKGLQRDRVMELIVDPAGTARLRTYSYQDENDQKREVSPFFTNPRLDPANIRLFDNAVVISIDSKAQSLKSDQTSLIANQKDSRLENEIREIGGNEEGKSSATQITITENQGRPWMLLSTESSSDLSKHEVVTAAPLSLVLDSESRLRINSTLKNEIQLSRVDETIALDHAQGATLDLSTDQHLFVGVEVYQRESDRYNRIAVYNDFQVAAGSSLGSRFENDNAGNSVLSVTSRTELSNKSNLSFEAGQSNANVFMTVRAEHQFNKQTSLSVGASNSDERRQEFILQFKAKF